MIQVYADVGRTVLCIKAVVVYGTLPACSKLSIVFVTSRTAVEYSGFVSLGQFRQILAM
jgi:hypothetical protein